MNIVIFAGGVGTRLWPLSRQKTPKQFGKIIDGKSTLQQTIDRLKPDFSEKDVYIATVSRYEALLREQLPDIPQDHFLFEPAMRDNGPAVALSAYTLFQTSPDKPMAILWSDHMVKHPEEFRRMMKQAETMILGKEADFVLLAQKPRFANQNMGWIHVGELQNDQGGISLYPFQSLTYRPSVEEAQQFMESGSYMWNLGYFVTTPRYIVSLLESRAPEVAEKLTEIMKTYGTDNYTKSLEEIYPHIPKSSCDDLIVNNVLGQRVSVLAEDLEWSDIGAWESLKEAMQSTKEDNVTHGNVTLLDSNNTLAFNYEEKLIVGIDLDDMVIVNTDDAVLICPSQSVPKVKKFVEALEGTEHEHLI